MSKKINLKKLTAIICSVCLLTSGSVMLPSTNTYAASKTYKEAKASVKAPVKAQNVKLTALKGGLKVTFKKGKNTNNLDVMYKASSSGKWNVKNVAYKSTKTAYTVYIKNLKENVKYDVKVRSKNTKKVAYKKGKKTLKKTFTKTAVTKVYKATTKINTPSKAQNVKVTALTGGFTVSFDKGKNTNKLDVMYKASSSSEWVAKSVAHKSTKTTYKVTINNLKENTSYDVLVRSRNAKNGKYVTVKTKVYTVKTKGTQVSPSKPDDPVTPVNPSKPDDPVTPVNPSKPDDPVTPVNPSKPDDPVTPVNPSKPDDPVTPVNPSKPDEPVTPVNPSDSDEPTDPTNSAQMKTYLNYNGVKVHLGEYFTDSLNAALNGGTAVAPVARRMYVDVYTYDTVDFDNFLLLYVFIDPTDGKQKVGGWIAKEGSDLHIDESESEAEVDTGLEFADSYRSTVLTNNIFYGWMDAYYRETYVSTLEAQREEELLAEQCTNATRVAFGSPIVIHNEELYNAHFGAKNFAINMANKGICDEHGHSVNIVFDGDPELDKLVESGQTYEKKLGVWRAGANLGYGDTAAETFVTAICEDMHRGILLSDMWSYISFAIGYNENHPYQAAWVQYFYETKE